MATTAYHDTDDGYGAKPPISLHPAFPAIVALWFAVLLGLGSLVLPAALLERAALASGLASLAPAAAPPLGLTARLVIALVAAGAGALGGLALARRLAGLHAAAPAARFDEDLARIVRRPRDIRPLDIRAEIGDDDDFPPVHEMPEREPPPRRRALALAETADPPGLPVAPPAISEDEYRAAQAAEPLHEAEAIDDPADPHESPAWESEAAVFEEECAMTDNPDFQPDFRTGFQPDHAEPLPFAPPSPVQPAAEAETPEPAPEPAPEPRPEAVARPAPEPVAFRGDWTDTPLDRLGLVQLVERLGASLERRRARTAALPPPTPAPVLPTGLDAAAAEEAAQAMASYFGRPAEAPAAEPSPAPTAPAPKPELMQRFGAMLGGDDGDDEGDDWMAAFSLPLRKPAAPPAAADSADEDEAGDERCGSLLAMATPAARKSAEVVRFADADSAPPQPAAARDATGETDAALRAALATLQNVRATG